MHGPVAAPGDNAFMHDKPHPKNDSSRGAGQPHSARPLDGLIAELEVADPAAAPDIADQIAARLEADLAAASAGRERAGGDAAAELS